MIVAPASTTTCSSITDSTTIACGETIAVAAVASSFAPRTPTNQIEVGLQELLGPARIDPVVGRCDPGQPAGFDELLKRVALDRDTHVGFDQVEHGRLHHVGAGIDQIRLRLPRLRLLDEASDEAGRVDLDHAERRSVCDRSEMDRGGGPDSAVLADQRGHVEIGDDVSVRHHERVVETDRTGRVGDRTARVERLRLDGVVDPHVTVSPVDERRGEGFGAKPERQHHVGHAAGGESIDHLEDHRPVHHRQHRLGDVVRERPEACTEAADEHDREHQPPSDVVGVSVGSGTVDESSAGVVSTGVVSPTGSVVALWSRSSGRTWSVSTAPSCGRFWAHGGIG